MSKIESPFIVPLNKATLKIFDEGYYYHFLIRNVPMMTRVVIKPGARTNSHHHESEEQTYYIISGKGRMYVGDETFDLTAQTAVLIPPGHPHAIENTGDEELEWLMQYLWPGEAASPVYSE